MTGVPLPDMPYRRRLVALRASGIGLWDAIVACRRHGSLDGAIRDATHGEVARVRRAAPAAGARLLQRPDRGPRASDVARCRLPDARAAFVVAGIHAAVRGKARRVAGHRRVSAARRDELAMTVAWPAIAGVALMAAMLSGCVGTADVAALHRSLPRPQHRRPLRRRVRGSFPSDVSFDSLDRDPATGAPVRHWRSPVPARRGPSAARHPAVVASMAAEECTASWRRGGKLLSLRHRRWRELLAAEGYVVLFPDSFRSRGVEEICTIPFRQSPITSIHRLLRCAGRARVSAIARRRRAGADRGARLVAWRNHRARGREREAAGGCAMEGAPGIGSLLPRGRRVLSGLHRCAPRAGRLCGVGAAPALRGRLRRLDGAAALHRSRRAADGGGRAGDDHRLSRHVPWLRRSARRKGAAARRAERRPSGRAA